MPISYELDRAASVIRTRCYGELKLAEVLDHFRQLRAEPDLPQHLDVFLDLRDSSLVPTAKQIEAASGGPGVLNGVLCFRYCSIVADRPALYGMARMWGILVERFFAEVNVFRTTEEADAWLNERRKPKPMGRVGR